jgi:hypothetical protein
MIHNLNFKSFLKPLDFDLEITLVETHFFQGWLTTPKESTLVLNTNLRRNVKIDFYTFFDEKIILTDFEVSTFKRRLTKSFRSAKFVDLQRFHRLPIERFEYFSYILAYLNFGKSCNSSVWKILQVILQFIFLLFHNN